MIRILRTDALHRLLRAAATARHDARTARRDLAELRTRHRALISHLARRDPRLVGVVPVPAANGAGIADPLTLVLLALWHQAVLEREAFRSWVTEEPPLVVEERQARAADAVEQKDRP
ncbi:hypothetical protein MHW47_06250 [Streptomyces sp. OfavH-34-F]|uniref:hypothetical protein n=1 Tax=Streptomyces sp. OfavH-34-F TaxID=2917760 RepID=UPI001EF2290A|nr:hypothetical protein [Streptomyces sp. OfavH-34-F]MCG7524043.1 hypothetical protein [Streptomyces sp. OfavH-34-F]